MPLLSRKTQLAIDIEGTYGTQATITNADLADRFTDKSLAIVRNGIVIDNPEGFGANDVIVGDASVTMAAGGYCNGSGTAGTPPLWFRLLQGSGMVLATAALSQSSDSSTWKGLTGWYYQDGRLRKGRGIMGNTVFTFESGKPVMYKFDGVGGYVETPSDVSMLSSATYNTTRPPVWAGSAVFTFGGGTTTRVKTLTLDLGNQFALREDPNYVGGYIGGWIGNSVPTVVMDPEAAVVATRCWTAAQAAGTAFDVTLVVGTVAGNVLTFTLDDLKVRDPATDGDRDGKLTDNVTFVVTGANGVQLAMT